jgi:UDP-glucose 4-epimerase
MKKVLVTGGFGFLGSHLTELLLARDSYRVHVVDDISSSPVNLEDYLQQIGRPAELTYDICTVDQYFARPGLPKYDAVYHLASPVGPAGVLRHAGNMVREIVRDTYTLIDYCIKTDAKLLDVSTSEIYGGGQQGYCPESTPKIVPANTTVRLEYAVAKLAAETAIINTTRVKSLKATIVRPFNVAGPRQSPKGGFVLPRFIQQIDAAKPLTVFGDGSAVRAFTHVKDMVMGIVLAMERGKNGEAYNIGNPANKTTILNLAKRIISVIGPPETEIKFVDPKTIYGPLYEEANDKYPDSQKALDNLNWQPTHGFDEVIRDAHSEYLRQKKAGVLKDKVDE